MAPLPPDVRRVEDLTAAHLGGATGRELAAFRVAALQLEVHLEVAERVAIVLLYGDGDWRERVAERVPLQWGLAQDEIDLHPGAAPPLDCPRTRRGGRVPGGSAPRWRWVPAPRVAYPAAGGTCLNLVTAVRLRHAWPARSPPPPDQRPERFRLEVPCPGRTETGVKMR